MTRISFVVVLILGGLVSGCNTTEDLEKSSSDTEDVSDDLDSTDMGDTDPGDACADCAPDQMCCNGACVDLSEDATNCGSCGQMCSSGVCFGGECALRVFVTSETWAGDQIGGVNGGHLKCQEAAEDANLSGTYRAWLSDSTDSPITSFITQSTGPYVLAVSHTLVATSWSALLTPPLENAINETERGDPVPTNDLCGVPVGVWTGTNDQGENTVLTTHCGNWSNLGLTGTIGNGRGTQTAWTDAQTCMDCGGRGALYCFEQ